MRISDWSSDVCSSDLFRGAFLANATIRCERSHHANHFQCTTNSNQHTISPRTVILVLYCDCVINKPLDALCEGCVRARIGASQGPQVSLEGDRKSVE